MADETTGGTNETTTSIPDGRTTATPDAAALTAKLSYPEQYAQQQAIEKAAAAKVSADALSPLERRRQELMQSPDGIFSTDPVKQAAAATEMRKVLEGLETPEEHAAVEGADLKDRREFFGVEAPKLPPSVLQNYEENFSDWEGDFLVAARREGMPSNLVRDLRDLGVELGMSVDGRPLPEADLDRALVRFEGRLTPTQKTQLKSFWRRIEGGAA